MLISIFNILFIKISESIQSFRYMPNKKEYSNNSEERWKIINSAIVNDSLKTGGVSHRINGHEEILAN